MNTLADIVNVSIELEQPVINSTSFNNMLIVGPEPKINKNIPEVGIYSNITEVNEAGFVTEGDNADAVGTAARVAFSQSPPPSKVYIALSKRKQGLNFCDLVLITEDNYTKYLGNVDVPEGLPWLMCIGTAVPDNTSGPVIGETVAESFSTTIKADGEVLSGGTIAIGDTAYSILGSYDDCEIEATMKLSTSPYPTYGTVWHCIAEMKNGELVIKESYYEKDTDQCEDITDVLNTALDTNGWYVICPAFESASILEENLPIMKEWVETKEKIMIYPCYEIPGKETNLFRSGGIFVKETINQAIADVPKDNHFAHVAWVAKCLNYQSGAETWAMKTLVGIYPATINSTNKAKLDELNISYYATYSDRDITLGGKVDGGEWIDVIRFRDWLKNDMQVAVFELLVKNAKLPYTDGGIALVKNAMIASLKRGQDNGGIAPTEYDSNDEEIPGYTVSVPRASDIPDADKKQRVLNNCRFRARLAGAIHAVDIDGCLAYSM